MSKNDLGVSSPFEEKNLQEDRIETAPSHDLATDVLPMKATEFSDTQLKSNFDQLPILKAISTFKKTTFICFIAGFTAATDGMFHHFSLSFLNSPRLTWELRIED